ncbi:hypothetical protein YC2023_015673 [Brassica napus]
MPVDIKDLCLAVSFMGFHLTCQPLFMQFRLLFIANSLLNSTKRAKIMCLRIGIRFFSHFSLLAFQLSILGASKFCVVLCWSRNLFFSNIKHFEEKGLADEWDKVGMYLRKGQKVYEDLYKEMTQLLTRDNFRMCNVLNVLEFNSTVQKNAIVHDEDGKL